jgi:hypothetical protein
VRQHGDAAHVCIGYADLGRVGPEVAFGVNLEALLGSGRRDQLDNDLVADQRTSWPVHADVQEEAVLDLVPLAGPGRQVAHGDSKSCLFGQAPELVLPEPNAVAVAAATVGADQQLMGVRIGQCAVAAPPAAQTLDCESSGLVALSDIDPTDVALEVVDAVGDGLRLDFATAIVERRAVTADETVGERIPV